MTRPARILALLFACLAAACASRNASYYVTQKQLDHALESGRPVQLAFDESLRVDEYINAFAQDELPAPKEGEALALSMAWLQSGTAKDGRTLAQVAIRSRNATREERKDTLGLSFVLDVSGSMRNDNKLGDSLKALENAVLELPTGTWFSLVLFDDAAHLAIAPVAVTAENRESIVATIRNVQPGGGTNIEEGLIGGYAQMAQFPEGIFSRLVLLTDGQSNVGVTDPRELARLAESQYREGARISTIGLGHNVDERVLRKIAEDGSGDFYFADTAETLTKFLREELRGMLIPVATGAKLRLSAAGGARIITIYGYENAPRDESGAITIDIGDLDVDNWRILMVEVEGAADAAAPLHAELSYADPAGAARPTLAAATVRGDSTQSLNRAVARNAVIFVNAMALKDASRLQREDKVNEALDLITVQLANTQVAMGWDDTGAMAKEADTLAKTRLVLLRTKGVDLGRASAKVEVPEDQGLWNEANKKRLLRAAFRIGEQLAPGPWGILVGVFADVYLADDAEEGSDRALIKGKL